MAELDFFTAEGFLAANAAYEETLESTGAVPLKGAALVTPHDVIDPVAISPVTVQPFVSKKGRVRAPRTTPTASDIAVASSAPSTSSKARGKPNQQNRYRKPSRKELEEQAKKIFAEEKEADGDEGLFDDLPKNLYGDEVQDPSPQPVMALSDAVFHGVGDEYVAALPSDFVVPQIPAAAHAPHQHASAAPATVVTSTAVDLTPFEFSQDPRALAGVVKPEIASYSEYQARNKVCNFGQWAVQQRAFALSFAFDKHGDGAISGPYAAAFFSMPGVAEAFAHVWRQYCEDETSIDKQRWALENFAKSGAYDNTFASIAKACVDTGLPPVKLVAELPKVTVGPRSKSARKVDDNVEMVAPLELTMPAVPGTPVGESIAAMLNGNAKGSRKRSVADEEGIDRRYTIGSACHRSKRLPAFEAKLASANDVVAPTIALQTGAIEVQPVPQPPAASAESLQRDAAMVDSFIADDSIGPIEPSPPAHQQVCDGASLVGSMHVYVLSLRGTTTNTGLLACSAVLVTCGVTVPKATRPVLCV